MKITVEFDPQTQSVRRIEAPEFQNLFFLAAILEVAAEQAKFNGAIARAQEMEAKSRDALAHQQIRSQIERSGR